MTAPHWDSTGQPTNLPAAATDALNWLQLFRSWNRRLFDENEARLDRAIEALTVQLSATRVDNSVDKS
ncbi:MAG TPA: hypothetical protein PLC99_22365 [Verrucomicrobiota bacterium]|nr:hypothetical protein [Verrucomicrobiota bacterium]